MTRDQYNRAVARLKAEGLVLTMQNPFGAKVQTFLRPIHYVGKPWGVES